MNENFCFWTVAPGEAAHSAQELVSSARTAGVFKDIHVWTDAPAIADANCHELGRFEPWGGLYRFTYLRDAVRALDYEYYAWIEPGTKFIRDPGSVLRVLRHAPVHVPLTFDLADPSIAEEPWGGAPCGQLAEQMRSSGVQGRFIMAAFAGFFIVHRDAVETFFRLAFDFWHRCEKEGVRLTCEPLLAYTGQMLTSDPRRHHVSHGTALWLPQAEVDRDPTLQPAIVGL